MIVALLSATLVATALDRGESRPAIAVDAAVLRLDAGLLGAPAWAALAADAGVALRVVSELESLGDGRFRVAPTSGEAAWSFDATLVTRPSILVESGRAGEIVVGRAVPHLEVDASGCWSLASDAHAREGIAIAVTPSIAPDGRSTRLECSIARERVAGRLPDPTTSLDVGRPIIAVDAARATVLLAEGRRLVVVLPARGVEPAIVLVLSAVPSRG